MNLEVSIVLILPQTFGIAHGHEDSNNMYTQSQLFILIGHMYLNSTWYRMASRMDTKKDMCFKRLDCMFRL